MLSKSRNPDFLMQVIQKQVNTALKLRTYTTLIWHPSRASICPDRLASNSQFVRSLDEQAGLSLPRGCVNYAQ